MLWWGRQIAAWPIMARWVRNLSNGFSRRLLHQSARHTGQQRFCPKGKNIFLRCIFGRWIQICFQNFSITHIFRCRLKGWNLLLQDTVCFYHVRHEEFKEFFSLEDSVMFCNDICSVMEVLGHEYNPDQWRLFIDSSKVNTKVVLLHNGNRFPSVPLAHAVNTKESYENMKLLLGTIKYD